MYVCMNVIFTSCDRRTSNNNRKKQSQDNIRYKAENKKLDCYFYLTNGKDFLWRSVKYSSSWYERIRVPKLARYSGMWYSLCKKSLNCFSSESLREDDRCGAPVDGRCVEDCRLPLLSLPLSTICAHREFPFPPPSTSSTNLVSKKTEHLYSAL